MFCLFERRKGKKEEKKKKVSNDMLCLMYL